MQRSHTLLLAATVGTVAGLLAIVSGPSSLTAHEPPKSDEVVPGSPAPAAEMITTKSGLQYRIVEEGTGDARPRMGDEVTVHYTGKLDSGKVFDSSRKKGRPATFAVGGLIPGWNEALQLMKVGAKFELVIPSKLAYGESGMGRDIPPNATLHFELELLSFKSMPRFVKPDVDAQVATESGLKYEVLVAADGEAPTVANGVELKYAFWATNGQLLGCSEKQGDNLKGLLPKMQVPFLKEAPLLMQLGSRYRFEVPGKLGFGENAGGLPDNGVTIWDLELVRIVEPLPDPEFAVPPDDELTTTASGLKYEVITAGAEGGTSPKMREFVTVHYCGWLTDGTKFDSSFERGFETSFQLGKVVPGWNEGLQLMKPGAKYLFVVPPNLAYGSRGAPPTIGPNATLVFFVEYIRPGK